MKNDEQLWKMMKHDEKWWNMVIWSQKNDGDIKIWSKKTGRIRADLCWELLA